MSNSDWITIWGIAITFFITVVGGVWILAFRIGGISARILSIEKTLDALVNTVAEMRIDITELQVKLEILWKAHVSKSNSPISLNEIGEDILVKSNIGTFAEEHYTEILSRVRAFTPGNAYQAQEVLISIVGRFKRDERYKLVLQEVAFSSGYDIDSLLFVAALSIRDRVISDLGFDTRSVTTN